MGEIKPDPCTKIRLEFQNAVLGSYSWEWEGELAAEKVFYLLRPFFEDAMTRKGFPPPVIQDLREEPSGE